MHRVVGRGSAQLALNLGIESAVEDGTKQTRGEVFTRRWVVDLILDMAGYTADRDLGSMVAVEPCCGGGAFLVPMIQRLVASCRRFGRDVSSLAGAVIARDLAPQNVEVARGRAVGELLAAGLSRREATRVASAWVRSGDFLLDPPAEGSADFVLGNPPYVRLENMAPTQNAAYRQACRTMRGRSDIFIGFMEVGLRLLKPDGVLGFIVADRWMRNQYGSSLRALVTSSFAVDTVIEMHDVDAFEDEVSAYPAITILRRQVQGKAIVASTTAGFSEHEADRLRAWSARRPARPLALPSVQAATLKGWFDGDGPWPSASPQQLNVLAELEARCPPLQNAETGTRVSIGIATGADDVFLTTDERVVERERLLPLAMASDLASGRVEWSGTYLINPWEDAGLVDLKEWPRFRAFVEEHRERLQSRHTAIKSPLRWYRTIDRMTPGLAGRPKLLLPEMKSAAHPVLEAGTLYPHHNLYHVTSESWDLEVLGALMLSDMANLFIGAYCVKMRGGTYRFQAQYLRRIRVPSLDAITAVQRRALARAFADRDVEAATAVAVQIYGIDARDLPSPLRRTEAMTS